MSRATWELASGGKETGISALFKGASLLNHSGEAISCITGLKDKIVLLYFGASWAEPCKSFNKLLTMFYDIVRASGDDSIAVIFVSNDKSREEQVAFFNDDSMHSEWLMVEWVYDLEDIMDHFEIEKIPWLLVADRDGKAIVRDAKDEVFDLLTDDTGKLRPAEQVKASVEAKWTDWRRLAGDWRVSTGHTLGGNASASASSAAAETSSVPLQNDREAMRAARLAALERRQLQSSESVPAAASAAMPAAAPSIVSIASASGAASASAASSSAASANGSGTFAAGNTAMPSGVAYTLSGGRVDLPPVVPSGGYDDDIASDTAAADIDSIGDDADVDGNVEMALEEAVSSMTAMGFPEAQAREALEVTHGDPDRAVALLLGDA